MSMIDPNQIINLAPSQNVGQPTVPFAPGSATAAVYDRDLDQDVAGSIMRARAYDPTAAAKAIRLSQETRIPFPLVQDNYDDVANRQKVTGWQQVVSQNHTLAPLLRDPEFVAAAQDDSQNVGAWQRLKLMISDVNKAREDWWFDTTRDIATGGLIGFRVAQRGQVGARMMDAEITPEDRETIRRADADLKSFERPGSFLGSAAELIGQQVVTVPEALREAAVGATAGGIAGAIGGPLAPATMAGGMALGGTAGLITGFARQAYRVEAGNAYVDMIDKGVEPDTAYPVAMGVGLVNASLELGGASLVAKPFQQAFRVAAKNAINEAIVQPTTRQALRAAGGSYIKAIGGETSTEMMQEIVTMAGEETALAASGIDSEFTAGEAAKRVVDTAIHTAMGMAVLGVPGSGATLYTGMRAAARAQREQNVLTQIAQNAKDTKFRADAPTVYERLAASQLNGTSAETTYIDAERVKEVLDQAGLTPAEIDQVLPGVREQLPEALASRGDVTIPTAKWATNTVGTKVEAALLPHMRLSATSMSPMEAAAFQAEREQLVGEAEQILEQKRAVDNEWTRQAKAIADTIREQAIAVRGMTETDADVFASGVQAFYVTKAAEMGMTPEQLFREAPYTIRGEQAAAPMEQAVSTLEQANRDIIASVDTELGGIMDAAKEASRAAGKTKSKDTQAAAFKAKQDWIAANQARYAEYQTAQRMDALERERIREAAESALAGKIDESLATAAQTLTDAGFVLDYESPAPSKSRYYRKGNALIRLSDHEIPVTPERAAAREAGVQPPYRDFVFDGTATDQELLTDLRESALRTSPNIMEQAATMDAEYMAAVERGDMETAQRMVDEAARAAMPQSVVLGDGDIGVINKLLRVYHGSGAFIRQFMYDFTGQGVDQLGSGFYFTTDRPEAESYMTRRRDGETVKIGGESQPTVVEAYLDIRNPLRADQVGAITREQIRRFIASAPEETRREGLENWGIEGDAPSAKVLDVYAFKDANIVRELFKIGNDFYGRNTEAFNRAIRDILGYDGVVQDFRSDGVKKLHYVAFFPEQIKSADPITYDESGNVIPLSRRFDITSPRIFEQAAVQPRLMAVHNLSADNLAFADRMGGLAVPSIGVITEEQGGVEGFGEITLIGTREMGDPATSRVFSSDAYSARFPRAEWPKVAYAKANKFVDQLREVAARFEDRRIIDETFDAMVNSPDAQKVVNYWMRSMPVMALFLSEKGVDIAPIMRERNTLSRLSWDAIDKLRPAYEAVDQQLAYDEMEASPEYRNLQEQYAEAVRTQYAAVKDDLGESTVEQWATQFTPTTLQRLSRDMSQADRQTVDDTATRTAIDAAMEPFVAEFKSWVDAKVLGQFKEPFLRVGRARKPYTLANIVDVMTSPKVRGEEKGMTFGAGAARAEAATEFVDLEEMREAARAAVVDPGEYSKAAKKSEAQLSAYREAVIEYTTLTDWRGKSDTWAALDGSMRALATYGTRKRKDVTAMRRALAKEGFASNRMPAELIEQAIDAAEALFNAPVPYFEAKPQRAVGLGEFAGAVIPSDADQQVRDILDRNGLAYMTYIAGDETDRQRAVRQMAQSPEARGDVLFQAPVAPGFYSALEREVAAIDAKALTASGWAERMKGLISKGAIKVDELEWSGLADHLKMQEGKVSKDAVLEFLRGNGVRVERVGFNTLSAAVDAQAIARDAFFGAFRERYGSIVIDGNQLFDDDIGFGLLSQNIAVNQLPQDLQPLAQRWLAASVATDQEREAETGYRTRYERYTLPGGTNYREVLLTLPAAPKTAPIMRKQYQLYENGELVTVGPDVASAIRWSDANPNADIRVAEVVDERATAAAARKRGEFVSPHWSQTNVLVHLRMNDRVDADGKRVLFVEEVQSDWGQAGVKYGFANQRAADEAELADLLAQQEANPTDARKKQIARVRGRIRRGEYNVFRAPYVETTEGWLNLGLKQVLLEAVRGNYDRVAFVDGQQSKDRYDLSKQVESLSWTGYDSRGATKLVSIYPNQGNPIELPLDDKGVVVGTGNQYDGKELDEIVPKEIAEQIMGSRGGELAGDQLKVGGEGMVAFYDKIVPAAMNKLLKKYGGGKIGQIGITESNAEVGREVSGGWNVYVDGLLDADRPTFRTEAEALASISLQQPGFDITPELVATLESGLPLFQAAAEGPRGGFDPRTLTTFINKGGDLSTWIHETAHFHFTVLGRLASRADAPESIRADMDTLLQWGKVDGATPEERLASWNAMTTDQQRKLHEQFAYSWEVYQFEGKAPSVEMQGVFERFRMWLMRVYKSVLEINAVYRSQFGEDLPALTPEVRQVMDRMLATQEQIERQQAIDQMIPSFQSQEESGMSDAEWAAYQKMQSEATEAAVTDLGKASLSQMEWLSGARSRLLKRMQSRNAKARRDIRDEVSEAVQSEPKYRALRYIRTGKIEGPDGSEIVIEGPHKLSTAGVREINDALPMDRLIDLNLLPEGIMAEGGRDPDSVAEDFGFDSGDAMLRAMVGMRSLADEIAARTDARLLAENALLSPEQMEEEVQRAIHNEARARFVAVEQRWLERLDKPARIILEAAKQAARAKVAGTLVRDLRPQQWIAAESKAARDARMAYSNRRSPEEIGRSVYTRVYNEQEAAGTGLMEAQVLAEAARVKAVADAQARLDAFRKAYPEADPAAIAVRAKRAQTYNNQMAAQTLEAKAEVEKALVYLRRVLRPENRKKMGADYADQIEGILKGFDLVAISTDKARARQSLADWLAGERKKGLEPELPPLILNEAERKPYKNLTVAEFRELADSIRTLEYQGKHTTKVLLAGKRLEFEAARDRIVEHGTENAEKRGRKAKPLESYTTKMQRRIEAIRGYHAAQLTPSAIIQTIDGGEDGPLSRWLLETFAEQANFQTDERVRATKFLDDTLRPIIKSPRNRPIFVESVGRSMQMEERLVTALNYGNEGNAKRLLMGEGWTEEQVADILSTLTKAELEAVQKIWDFFETFRPMISAKERRLTGRDLEYVDRRELVVPRTADGQSVTLPGGYYPIRYDPRRSTTVQALDDVEAARRMMDGARTASTTSDTFKKKRSQNGLGQPLTLTMNALYSGVNEVIDDLAWQEWLIAANRLTRDAKFTAMVRERYGEAYYQQLREWISTVAVGDRVASSAVENIAVAVRQNVSVSAMAWRAITAGIQITGLFPAAAKIGTIPMLRGLTYLMTSPKEAMTRAREKSRFMASRGRTRYRDLNEIRNLVRGETGIRRNYMATAYAAIGAIQSISDNATWWGRYEAAKRDGKDEDTAVFLADQAVKDTQGSGLTGDLSSVMRGGKAQSPYVKLFTSFMQYSNTMYSLISERAMTANGRGDLAARLFLILIPGAIIEELLRSLLTAKAEEDEPEDLVRRLAANQLDYLIGLPFGLRELTGIGDVIFGVQPRYQYRGPSGLRAISATGQLVNELSQGEVDAGLRRAFINFIGISTGAPSVQINATIDGIEAIMEGEAEGADVILAPITGFKTR